MKHWSLYRPSDGVFVGIVIGGPNDEHLPANVPEGLEAIEGEHDHLSRRVDLKTGDVVDYQPPAPSDDFEWDETTKRWLKRQAAIDQETKAQAAAAAIALVEVGSLRAMRELLLDPTNADARAKLQQADAAIVEQRAVLSADVVEMPAVPEKP